MKKIIVIFFILTFIGCREDTPVLDEGFVIGDTVYLESSGAPWLSVHLAVVNIHLDYFDAILVKGREEDLCKFVTARIDKYIKCPNGECRSDCE